MKFKTIDEVGNLKGKRVILRLDLNTPVVGGKVEDDFRIKQSLPTINFLRDAGARIIVISHIEGKGGDSLEPASRYLAELFPLKFIKKYPSAELEAAINGPGRPNTQKSGEIILLENLRLNPGEKSNDENFARSLAALGDIYVNEAFSASHRKHASIVGVPRFIPGYAGLLFNEEVKNLSRAFKPAHPFLFVIGGAKFETKMPLIEKFLKGADHADHIFVGGALANDFFRAQGFEIGKSIVSEGDFDLKALLSKIILPTDVVVENSSGGREIKLPNQVGAKDAIWDAGPAALAELKKLASEARFILWNGPLGNYEIGFKEGTEEFAKIVAKNTAEGGAEERGALSIVGGGDTVAAIESLGISDKFTFLSTAGGAMLEFLVDETLPGIEAIS